MRSGRRNGDTTIETQPIKTDRDYRRVREDIDRLMDARPNTPDGDRLDALTTLVEAWEEKHHPIGPPDPVVARD